MGRKFTVTLTMTIGAMALAGVLAQGGCREEAPPPRVPVPTSENRDNVRQREYAKPLPEESREEPRPYLDMPLESPPAPEGREYVEAYRHIGQPRITIFVNRTLEGAVVPVNEPERIVSIEREHRQNDTVKRDSTDIYLHRGQYDEAEVKGLDYEALENRLADWLGANGNVTVVSPTLARQRLSDEQVKDLQSGRPRAMAEIAQQLQADVLIQVQAHPTRQTARGVEIRMVAEAMNIRGGQAIAHAMIDVDPPLAGPQIEGATRVLARKLMVDMTRTWQGAAAAEVRPAPTPPQRPLPPPQDRTPTDIDPAPPVRGSDVPPPRPPFPSPAPEQQPAAPTTPTEPR